MSTLPVVDELVVAVAPGDSDDDTRGLVASIDDERVRIVDAVWDDRRRQRVYADLTNAALDACRGDWCLYVQADEVLHEDDHATVLGRCEELLGDPQVHGLLFDYLHFFGDYDHLQTGHGWYRREIRVVRNGIGVRSARDAQSFRFAGESRIDVARARARIFHYGWARDPRTMQTKVREFWSHRRSPDEVASEHGDVTSFDYGPLGRLERYCGTHPGVMAGRIASMDWRHELREVDPPGMKRALHRDERPSFRVLSALSRVTGVDLNHTNHGRELDL